MPLSSMTYYDLQDGVLTNLATIETEDPETEINARVAS